MGSQVVTWVSSFLLMLFLPRYLGSEDYGRLFLAISIATIFQIVINFGSQYHITKEVSRSRANTPQLLVNSVAIRALLWGISITAMISFSYLAGYSTIVKVLILILGVQLLWTGVTSVLSSCFRGYEKMEYPSLGAIVERVFVAVAAVSALLMGANSIVIAALIAVSTLLKFSICARLIPRIVSHLPKVDWNATVALVKRGIPYFLWGFFAIIYYRIDAVMMSLMTPEAVVGWYGAAYRFFDILMFLPSILSIAVFPVLSRLWKKEKSMLARTTQKSLELILVAGVPLSIGVFAFSEQVIHIFFGLKDYAPSVLVLQIFSVGLLLVYVDFVLGTTLLASDKQRQWSIVAFIAVLLNVSLNYFLIPYSQTHLGNGGIGAAIATLVTEYFVMVTAIALIPKDIFATARVGVAFKAISSGILMVCSIWLARKLGVPWIAQALTGTVTYFVALLAMKTFEPSELAFIRSFFSFRNLKSTFVTNGEP